MRFSASVKAVSRTVAWVMDKRTKAKRDVRFIHKIAEGYAALWPGSDQALETQRQCPALSAGLSDGRAAHEVPLTLFHDSK
jgi:hypothetical protein